MSVTLEQIVRRHFPQADRASVQEAVARQVERTPELYLARYCKDPRSMGGRYVNSDLFKETFADIMRPRNHADDTTLLCTTQQPC